MPKRKVAAKAAGARCSASVDEVVPDVFKVALALLWLRQVAVRFRLGIPKAGSLPNLYALYMCGVCVGEGGVPAG